MALYHYILVNVSGKKKPAKKCERTQDDRVVGLFFTVKLCLLLCCWLKLFDDDDDDDAAAWLG